MKKILSVISLCLFAGTVFSQAKDLKHPDPSKKIDTVEAACGMCQFDMPGDDCALAIRINGKSYYVDGAHIDAYGNAHAKDGFCNSIRKAEVQGVLVENIYKLTYFKLIPSKIAAKEKKQ